MTDGHKRALELIAENKRTRSPFLDLGNLGLTEVPEEVGECVWLEELVLGSMWNEFNLAREGMWLTGSERALNGDYNHFTAFPNSLINLKKLKKLVYSVDSFKLIMTDCSSIGTLPSLEYLILEGLDVLDYSFLYKLNNLKSLNLGNSNFIDFEIISRMNNLEHLIVSHYEKTPVLNFHLLGKLSKLKTLYLDNLEIYNISPIANMPYLKTLVCRKVYVSDISPVLKLLVGGVSINQKAFYEGGINFEQCPLDTPPIEIVNKGNDAIFSYFDSMQIPHSPQDAISNEIGYYIGNKEFDLINAEDISGILELMSNENSFVKKFSLHKLEKDENSREISVQINFHTSFSEFPIVFTFYGSKILRWS